MKQINNFKVICIAFLVVGTVLTTQPAIHACEEAPGVPTIQVQTGAVAGNEPNYYVVAMPETGTVTVKIKGDGKTPCLTDEKKCSCEHNSEKVTPDPDGDPVYTFSKTIGTQDPDDSSLITFGVDWNTTPGVYKFKITKIQQNYKACPEGLTGSPAPAVNSQESIEITILVCRVAMVFESSVVCDGRSINVNLVAQPTLAEQLVLNGSFMCQKPDGSINFQNLNPLNQGSIMELAGGSGAGSNLQWRIPNALWFSTQDDHCNVTSEYKVVGTVQIKGVTLNVKNGSFTVSASGSDYAADACIKGVAKIITKWDGTPKFITTYNTNTQKHETTITQDTFTRKMKGGIGLQMPVNSQFYSMLLTEENYHVNDQIENLNHPIMKTTFLADKVLTQSKLLEPFSAQTAELSKTQAKEAFDLALADEENRSFSIIGGYPGTNRCSMEREAKNAASVTFRPKMECAYPLCTGY